MEDLIKRSDAIAMSFTNSIDEGGALYVPWREVKKNLEELPSAQPDHSGDVNGMVEPKRKKGEWERHYSRPNVYADLYWHCSECGYKNDDQYANVYHHFCPNCGSDMRMEGEEP